VAYRTLSCYHRAPGSILHSQAVSPTVPRHAVSPTCLCGLRFAVRPMKSYASDRSPPRLCRGGGRRCSESRRRPGTTSAVSTPDYGNVGPTRTGAIRATRTPPDSRSSGAASPGLQACSRLTSAKTVDSAGPVNRALSPCTQRARRVSRHPHGTMSRLRSGTGGSYPLQGPLWKIRRPTLRGLVQCSCFPERVSTPSRSDRHRRALPPAAPAGEATVGLCHGAHTAADRCTSRNGVATLWS